MPLTLTPDIVAAAIEGFEAQKRRIDEQIAELRAMASGQPSTTVVKPSREVTGKKKFSAASRRKMALAQKARWAKLRGETGTPVAIEAEKPKRHLSEEGRKRIIAATKRRWRLQKAAQKAKTKVVAPLRAKSRRALPAPGEQE